MINLAAPLARPQGLTLGDTALQHIVYCVFMINLRSNLAPRLCYACDDFSLLGTRMMIRSFVLISWSSQ